jgi:hypothetical protein
MAATAPPAEKITSIGLSNLSATIVLEFSRERNTILEEVYYESYERNYEEWRNDVL